ncbi:glycolate oxidase iron-sulfur subunit [Thiomonas arsenitoxydans]|uniref:Glycolate oxidase iron-sulfur subunit n=1 Tax=Thiomonas arsenitoxydans (strain DSM 22701 / CIP 110005 / 3As) TaxID=426114 RepID=D6CKM5_THIA3|nr:glycolate oxidase subunit GlcF [Thiomonas arsenitoxydans]CAZ87493.1 Glycolate oxidase iron-sulfur subunit [Thiomonas arsenitoxydans]CQR27198.1 glycolate oxidase iron-sulfur subunit [Thiomonas arsenitoxydans]CQR29684.1 glycolate oxidase iron-sulfur subunit [Thiomonas arsenitoxydans]CQR29694.1 glycolate oxidase iron-sulfur subunit [Thiomonas arsenitoxydans]CQR32849.1 glycolate oxidase iron-sulfur subunit [Thiomonas arsenitoxydans]
METHLSPEFASTPEGQQAEAILRNCVHCGFCTATCPTYQLLGDELDGPRGRIYQIKQALEGEAPTRTTQLHLDRCLTCRNCETTCPSGVEYGRLVDIGRAVVDAKVERPAGEKLARWALREGMTSSLFAPAIKLGQALRPLVPAALRDKVPPRQRAGKRPQRDHARKVLMLGGCVQPTLMPNIGAATARVLDAVGVQPLLADGAGCCGAIRQHLSDHDGALADMKRNVDAWWPLVESGAVEAIVMDASGCGAMVKEYGHHLLHDPAYAERAQRISALCQDISEYLPQFAASLKTLLKNKPVDHLAYHPPCTLQHAQQVRGGAEALLRELGFEVKLPLESHLCCGSAGTYSVLQPELSKELRNRKLQHLAETAPQRIVSSNIGCIQHLQSGTTILVQHWVELLDEALHGKP